MLQWNAQTHLPAAGKILRVPFHPHHEINRRMRRASDRSGNEFLLRKSNKYEEKINLRIDLLQGPCSAPLLLCTFLTTRVGLTPRPHAVEFCFSEGYLSFRQNQLCPRTMEGAGGACQQKRMKWNGGRCRGMEWDRVPPYRTMTEACHESFKPTKPREFLGGKGLQTMIPTTARDTSSLNPPLVLPWLRTLGSIGIPLVSNSPYWNEFINDFSMCSFEGKRIPASLDVDGFMEHSSIEGDS